MPNHYHVIVWAAMDRVEGQFSQVTYVDVIAESVDEAVEKAKRLCPDRRHFWVNNIIEHHDHDVVEE